MIENDSIALIPGTREEIINKETGEKKIIEYMYPLNLSYWAREFSKKDKAVTFILFSGCRNYMNEAND